jgi:hypothetical protein
MIREYYQGGECTNLQEILMILSLLNINCVILIENFRQHLQPRGPGYIPLKCKACG